jgi:hypothetical protein
MGNMKIKLKNSVDWIHLTQIWFSDVFFWRQQWTFRFHNGREFLAQLSDYQFPKKSANMLLIRPCMIKWCTYRLMKQIYHIPTEWKYTVILYNHCLIFMFYDYKGPPKSNTIETTPELVQNTSELLLQRWVGAVWPQARRWRGEQCGI